MVDTSEESSSECSDSISINNFSIYTGSSSLDSMQTSSETVIFARKAYLKINLLVKTPLHKFMAVTEIFVVADIFHWNFNMVSYSIAAVFNWK